MDSAYWLIKTESEEEEQAVGPTEGEAVSFNVIYSVLHLVEPKSQPSLLVARSHKVTARGAV